MCSLVQARRAARCRALDNGRSRRSTASETHTVKRALYSQFTDLRQAPSFNWVKRITEEFGGASGSTDLMAGKVMFLRSNQGGILDGNESVADSFRSDLVGFKSWPGRIIGAFFTFLRLPEKTSSREANSARGHPSVAPLLSF
ncbi:hypothetical protein TNCV_5082881 [Trichonephila clavipes]|nr:hypothetical protein TNCV_5082881 [Trichonephila clavipes]